jgi:hypothetical protein
MSLLVTLHTRHPPVWHRHLLSDASEESKAQALAWFRKIHEEQGVGTFRVRRVNRLAIREQSLRPPTIIRPSGD